MKRLIVIGMLIFAAGCGAQTMPEVKYIWTAPTVGTTVDHYVVELNTNSEGWIEVGVTNGVEYSFTDFQNLNVYEVRVAGVDSLNRQGPYSTSSDPYAPDLGLPNQPSQPIIFQL